MEVMYGSPYPVSYTHLDVYKRQLHTLTHPNYWPLIRNDRSMLIGFSSELLRSDIIVHVVVKPISGDARCISRSFWRSVQTLLQLDDESALYILLQFYVRILPNQKDS